MLEGITVVNLALNLPGPAAARRLALLGARTVKVEPPSGDPMAHYSPEWYQELITDEDVVALDLKAAPDRERFEALLAAADLLLTSNRPAALAHLGLRWEDLHVRYPRLCQVAIVGYAPPQENEAGHDLTYQAGLGLLYPPHLPRTLTVDLVGAERAVSAALGLLLARERTGRAGFAQVVLAEAAASLAEPLQFHLTEPGGLLGGGAPEYNLYRAKDDWVAVAALEPRFKAKLTAYFGEDARSVEQWRKAFRGKTAAEWEQVGRELDVPLKRVDAA